MPPTLAFKLSKIAPEGDEDGPTQPDQFPSNLPSNLPLRERPTRTCDRDDCGNYKNLQKCGRCRSALYCSPACQRSDWPNHRISCELPLERATTEAPLQRHLRLFSSRFGSSVDCACIAALQLWKYPDHVDRFGLYIKLHPRPHREAGSRFTLKDAILMPMKQIKDMIQLSMPAVWTTHLQMKEKKKQESGGKEDYATMVIFAQNAGSDRLPGEHNHELRFRPVHVSKAFANSKFFKDSSLDWHSSLKLQIENDMPNRVA